MTGFPGFKKIMKVILSFVAMETPREGTLERSDGIHQELHPLLEASARQDHWNH
jgi:hypothetical protein